MNSKTIILSCKENNSSRGILTLYIEDDLLKCKLRLYSTPKLDVHTQIGIYHNDQVYKANLLEKQGCYTSSFVGDFDLNKDFYIAIINTTNKQVILEGGTYAGYFYTNSDIFTEQDEDTQNLIDSELAKQEAIEQNEPTDYDKCANCKYKQCFYNNISAEQNKTVDDGYTQIEMEEVNSQKVQNANKPNSLTPTQNEQPEQKINYLTAIVPQFNYIFDHYPQDSLLNSLMPNAKFVKISEGDQDYSIGAIYDNDTIKYICYAVKCNYNTPAPDELGEHYQWLPIDSEDPLSEGYYIVYQDAVDLKILRV